MSDEPKQYLVERVRSALAKDERVGELDFHVKVVGVDVFVHGTVSTAERRQAVSDVLRDELPGHRTHNEVTVLEPIEPPEEEQLT